jgi:hypothetical protein
MIAHPTTRRTQVDLEDESDQQGEGQRAPHAAILAPLTTKSTAALMRIAGGRPERVEHPARPLL